MKSLKFLPVFTALLVVGAVIFSYSGKRSIFRIKGQGKNQESAIVVEKRNPSLSFKNLDSKETVKNKIERMPSTADTGLLVTDSETFDSLRVEFEQTYDFKRLSKIAFVLTKLYPRQVETYAVNVLADSKSDTPHKVTAIEMLVHSDPRLVAHQFLTFAWPSVEPQVLNAFAFSISPEQLPKDERSQVVERLKHLAENGETEDVKSLAVDMLIDYSSEREWGKRYVSWMLGDAKTEEFRETLAFYAGTVGAGEVRGLLQNKAEQDSFNEGTRYTE